MICQDEIVDGWRHSLFYGDSSPAYSPCKYNAKYKLHITEKSGKTSIKFVCGIHKNAIVRHSNQVGYTVLIEEIKESE